jgi:hypothetical protein
VKLHREIWKERNEEIMMSRRRQKKHEVVVKKKKMKEFITITSEDNKIETETTNN